ncbi:hypothetical protein BCON_0251g00150 [Botryotinia convoluta]|uniref:Uncharacterized protein n=1 Tax=Botryotinia convoluta TaxID=54673 RepID=A0A4Z1HTG3_9HELO|nr:hypothetical protein BCON_0251g00150 [Botryotinia convoluta]
MESWFTNFGVMGGAQLNGDVSRGGVGYMVGKLDAGKGNGKGNGKEQCLYATESEQTAADIDGNIEGPTNVFMPTPVIPQSMNAM